MDNVNIELQYNCVGDRHRQLPLFSVLTIQFAAGRMEPKGCERHRWVKPRDSNGADGISDIEGKAATGSGERAGK